MKLKCPFEFRRQIFHLFFGLLIAIFLKNEFINKFVLLAILIFGAILIIIYKKKEIPILKEILYFFERKEHIKKFPGKGIFFLTLGSTLSLFIFEKNIAISSIIILAIGDSTCNIFGREFAKIKLFWNKKKNIEGVVFGILAASFGAFFINDTKIFDSILASSFAIFAESFETRIDDNLFIPIIAGFILTLISKNYFF